MTGDSETETSWKIFLESLKTRGLEGVDLVVSNAHKGLKSAIQKNFKKYLDIHFVHPTGLRLRLLSIFNAKSQIWIKRAKVPNTSAEIF